MERSSSLLPRLPAQRFESLRDIESPVPIEIPEFRKSPLPEFCVWGATVSDARLRSGRKAERVESLLNGSCAAIKRLLLVSESSIVFWPSTPNSVLTTKKIRALIKLRRCMMKRSSEFFLEDSASQTLFDYCCEQVGHLLLSLFSRRVIAGYSPKRRHDKTEYVPSGVSMTLAELRRFMIIFTTKSVK